MCNHRALYTYILIIYLPLIAFHPSGKVNGEEVIMMVTAFLSLSPSDGTVSGPVIKTGALKSKEEFHIGMI